MQFLGIIVVCVLCLANYSYGERTKDKIYIKIKSVTGCYRRMNGTHQIGCSSKRGGSNGVIHFCDTEADLDFILAKGNAPPYIPVMPLQYLTAGVVAKLTKNLDKVDGLLLYKSDLPDHFSHDRKCPNDVFNLKDTCQRDWNPLGTGLMFDDIAFPVFHVQEQQDVDDIRNCFNKFNNFSFEQQESRQLCSLQMNSFMFAATSTPLCRKRSNKQTNINQVKYCDPMGGYNVWASLFPLATGPHNNTVPNRDAKYVIIATRMDSTSFFEQTAGAHFPVTGMVTLLSVAKYLKTILPATENADRNVLFVLFNGEAYDYIGSQRMVYDMTNGDFPVKYRGRNDILPQIRPENISLFIEIGEMYPKKASGVFAHYLRADDEIAPMLERMQRNSKTRFSAVENSLPPASLQTFMKGMGNLSGIVVTDYKDAYGDRYYNSMMDDPDKIEYQYYNASKRGADVFPNESVQMDVARVATMIGRSVFWKLTGKDYGGVEESDVVLVDELFHCYLENPNCLVHKAINATFQKSQAAPLSLYVSIADPPTPNLLTPLLAMTLGWFTGDAAPANCSNKPRNYAYKYFNLSRSIYDVDATQCYKITFNQTEAVSPAFIIDDYDWKSGEYSSWSESAWEDLNVGMFLRPSPSHENFTVVAGSLMMILSFAVVCFVKSKSEILFGGSVPTEPPTEC